MGVPEQIRENQTYGVQHTMMIHTITHLNRDAHFSERVHLARISTRKLGINVIVVIALTVSLCVISFLAATPAQAIGFVGVCGGPHSELVVL